MKILPVIDRREHLTQQATLLINRLERTSVDSVWAHRASGHRGALLKWAERLEADNHLPTDRQMIGRKDLDSLQSLVEASFALLEKAAKERLR